MITLQEEDQALVVTVSEKTLDANNSKDFRRDLEKQLPGKMQVVVDMSCLTFVDSSGLGVLLSCLKQVRAGGGDLRLCCLTPQVRAVFQLVRMHRLFEIYNTRDEALRSFQ